MSTLARRLESLRTLSGIASLVCLALGSSACSEETKGAKGEKVKEDAGPADAGPKASPWSMLGFDLASTYHNPNETVLTTGNVWSLEQKWELAMPGAVSGGVVVDGETIYVVSPLTLSARNAKTGDVIWENPDVGGPSTPTLVDGVLYVNASAGAAKLWAVNAKDGKVIWSSLVDPHTNASGFSSPVVAGNLVVVGSSSFEEASAKEAATFMGAVVAYDRESGDEVWRFRTVEPPYNGCAVWGTVSIDLESRRVFAATGNNYTEEAGPTSDSVFALDLDTGDKLWQLQASQGDVFTIVTPKSPDSDFGANPILFTLPREDGTPRKVLGIGQKSGVFWVLDQETGDVVWQRPLGVGTSVGGVLNNGAYDGERIVVATSSATSEAPGGEAANGETPAIFPPNTSVLFALDPATGDILWERQLPAYVWAPITIANGVGFVAYETRIQAFNVETGEKLYEFQAAGTIAAVPVVSEGRVFFGSGMSLVVFGKVDDKLHALALPE